MPKQDFMQVFMATFKCLHYEPGYQITKPTLLLVGDHDTMGNIRKVAPHWAARDHCQYHVIAGAGHCANLDNPDDFDRLVLAFLQVHAG
jgi:pimeloyl-ACP methyl ester carboxylesterase